MRLRLRGSESVRGAELLYSFPEYVHSLPATIMSRGHGHGLDPLHLPPLMLLQTPEHPSYYSVMMVCAFEGTRMSHTLRELPAAFSNECSDSESDSIVYLQIFSKVRAFLKMSQM